MKNCLYVALVLVSLWCGGHCLGQSFTPDNNTVVTRQINDSNVRFECVVVDDQGDQVTTNWNIFNFRETVGGQSIRVPLPDTMLDGVDSNGTNGFITFRNILIFPTFLEDLDGTTLTCGSPAVDTLSVTWFLRVYREVVLQDLTDPIRFPEGENGLAATPEVAPTAHPFPSEFEWTASEGIAVANDSRRMFGYPALTINDVRRTDSGMYSLTATNRFLNESMDVLGSGAGSFTLDVLYGPEIEYGPTERAVRLGDPLMLLCGTGLDSNPRATVMWLDPAGGVVADNDRYDLIQDDAGIVRLDFNRTIDTDMGIWTCSIRVEGVNVTLPNGGGITPTRLIGSERSRSITLYIVEAPGTPTNLTVDSTGPTSAVLCWQQPAEVGQPGIAFYRVTATGNGMMVMARTTDNSTRLNMTNLLPNVEYEFRVEAVAMVLDVDSPSPLSEPVTATTDVTVPALVCEVATAGNGEIDVEWSFIHTGGLDLTSLSISYTIRQGDTNSPNAGPMVELDSTSTSIPNLVAGLMYVPSVQANNTQGSVTAVCPTVELTVGIPQDPEPPVISDLRGGRVDVIVRTLTSGLPEAGGNFYFRLTLTQTPIVDGVSQQPLEPSVVDMDVNNYVSGDEVTISLEDIVGGFYTFDVVAGNTFGQTGIATTNQLISNDAGTGGNAGAIAGGVIGGLLGVLLIVAVVIILVVIFLVVIRPRQNSYKPAASESRDDLNEAEASPSRVRVEEITIDVGTELSSNTKDAAPKELHYAELDTFRSPAGEKKEEVTVQSPKPVVVEDKPVEYATIDTFRKAPSVEKPSTPSNETPASVV